MAYRTARHPAGLSVVVRRPASPPVRPLPPLAIGSAPTGAVGQIRCLRQPGTKRVHETRAVAHLPCVEIGRNAP